jgi:import receptor subunit TOM22
MVFVHEIKDDELIDSDAEYTTDEETFSGSGSQSSRWLRFLPASLRFRLVAFGKSAWSAGSVVAAFLAKSAWIITTSALLVGLPILYAYDREKSMIEYEKEQQRFAPPVAADTKK